MLGHQHYSFQIGSILVRAYVQSEDMSPRGSFEDTETIEEIENGSIDWFCVTVEVLKNSHVIGSDHLGGCAYKNASEFFTSHRDPDPMNRNCSIMRAARGDNVSICHYFPDMVKQAIADARHTLERE